MFGCQREEHCRSSLVVRTQVRESQCKHLINSFSATCVAETRAHSRCVLHMGIHPDSRRSSYFFVPFLFIVIEPGCYRAILFIIWLNCYALQNTGTYQEKLHSRVYHGETNRTSDLMVIKLNRMTVEVACFHAIGGRK